MATTTTSRVRAARLLVLVLAVLQPVGSAVFTRWSPVPSTAARPTRRP
jgi:hypothetical protein